MRTAFKWKQFQTVNKCSAAQQLHTHKTLKGKATMVDGRESADRLVFVGQPQKILYNGSCCYPLQFLQLQRLRMPLDITKCARTMPEIYSSFYTVNPMNMPNQCRPSLWFSCVHQIYTSFPFSAAESKPWNFLPHRPSEASSLFFF